MNAESLKLSSQSNSFDQSLFSVPGTYIHPTAIVSKTVNIEDGVKIGPYCIITGNVSIGAGTRIYAHVAIGFSAQVLGMQQSLGYISIGQNCEIREFVSIHGARNHDGKTVVGNNCYIMNYSHISHDSFLEDNVTLINNVNLGGHTHIEKNAFLMANAATHQFCRIGQFTALAPFSATRQDLPPFSLFTGQPAAFAGLNSIALKRAGFDRATLNALKHVTKLFYQDKLPLVEIQKQAQAENSWGSQSHVQEFISFIEKSTRGVSRKSLAEAPESINEIL